MPIDATARRLPDLIADCELVEIEGAPHGMLWTHGAEANEALLAFVGRDGEVAETVGAVASTTG